MQTTNNLTAAQQIDKTFHYYADRHAEILQELKGQGAISYFLEWNAEEVFKLEHIEGLAHSWGVLKRNQPDQDKAIERLMEIVTEDIINWSPDRSTSPMARVREEMRLEALKAVKKAVNRIR